MDAHYWLEILCLCLEAEMTSDRLLKFIVGVHLLQGALGRYYSSSDVVRVYIIMKCFIFALDGTFLEWMIICME